MASGSSWFKESLVRRDGSGRFAKKGGGKTALDVGPGHPSAGKDKQETEMLARIQDVRTPSPMTYPDPRVKAGMQGQFEGRAETERKKGRAQQAAVSAARKVLGFTDSAAIPGMRGPAPASVATRNEARNKLKSLHKNYGKLASSDHAANYMGKEAQDTIQNLADGMGLGNLGEKGGVDSGPDSSMNRVIRAAGGR